MFHWLKKPRPHRKGPLVPVNGQHYEQASFTREEHETQSRAITMRAAASFLTRRLKTSAAASNATGAKRGMASGSHGHGHGKEYPFGMHFHVSPVHKNLALAYGTMLWLWVFYRAKEDGRVVLGLEHPWDHGHGDHHGDAAHSHSHGKIQYARAEIGERPSLVAAEEDEEDDE